jgi:uncharacterized membrane protein YoaK (UPF0700 family)
MRISVLALLTLNGGYTDTAGFLVLQGLFTAHVTGNFVTLAASLVHGTSGAVPKILALPVFCVVIFLVRYFSNSVASKGGSAFNTLVAVKVSLFILAAALAVIYGPFADGDALAAIVTGMALVAGMSIQNAAHRIFFGKSPPSTLMTGTTTQLMMDLSDLTQTDVPAELRAQARTRCAALLKRCAFHDSTRHRAPSDCFPGLWDRFKARHRLPQASQPFSDFTTVSYAARSRSAEVSESSST